MWRVEAKAQDMEAPAQSIAFFFQWKQLKIAYAVIFAHKGKSNTSFRTVKGLLLFVCTHNINKINQIENKNKNSFIIIIIREDASL